MTNEDGPVLAQVVDFLLQGRTAEVGRTLALLSVSDPVPPPVINDLLAAKPARGHEDAAFRRLPRPSLRARHLAPVLQRDGWRCHYCGRRLVVAGVIELVGRLCPDEFPFPGHGMPVGRTHPAAIRVYPNVDHVQAGSLGGSWHDSANLVAACTPCNERKSNRLGWNVTPPTWDGWDGLVSRYRSLVELAGVHDRRYHRDWLRALSSCVTASREVKA